MTKKHSGFIEAGTPTPTPWSLWVLSWGYQIVHGARVIAAISGWAHDPRKDAQAYADALLLAAAPDLLDALEQAVQLLDTIDGRSMSNGVILSYTHDLPGFRATIAKARGESEAQP